MLGILQPIVNFWKKKVLCIWNNYCNQRSCVEPDHILHGQFNESHDAHGGRLKSRSSLSPAARKILDSPFEIDMSIADKCKLELEELEE